MEKFIPYEKLSKKKQRELSTARRTTWSINPVTRKPANPKAYNRKTARNWKDDSNSVPFFIILFGSSFSSFLKCALKSDKIAMRVEVVKYERKNHLRKMWYRNAIH